MRILFVGVFDKEGKSTNLSQLFAFKDLGYDVIGYNYRLKAAIHGNEYRDKDLVYLVKQRAFDLVVFSKCNVVSLEVFKKISDITTTCLWFMDALVNYDQEMKDKTKLVHYFCCDKLNVLEHATKINKNSFYVCEGFDSTIDKPRDVDQIYDASFIGNIYGNRAELLSKLDVPVKVINNAFSNSHSIEVSKSKINLNMCTSDGASDRVYKIMAAKGFLITDDWPGREDIFIDGEHCVIFKDAEDLNQKINYYLKNPEEAKKIAEKGYKEVQKFNRLSWAKQIVSFYEQVK